MNTLEKEARVAGRPLVNLLGTRTYKHINLRASGLRIGLLPHGVQPNILIAVMNPLHACKLFVRGTIIKLQCPKLNHS